MKIFSVETVRDIKAHFFNDDELIQNRFDLHQKKWFWIKVGAESGVYWIPAYRKYWKLYLGVYLQSYPFDLRELVKNLFGKFWLVGKVYISHAINHGYGLVAGNNFVVRLPQNHDSYDSQLSKKLIGNIRYYQRKLSEKFEVTFLSSQEILVEWVELYLKWKYVSHGFTYENSPKKFLSDYSINACYYLYSKKSQSIVAILFCHQNNRTSFFENFAYDPSYSKYSPGKVLLYLAIQSHIDQGVAKFYMGGGPKDSYKADFANEIHETWSGSVSRLNLT